jgi:hypothetical protein
MLYSSWPDSNVVTKREYCGDCKAPLDHARHRLARVRRR